MVAIGPAPLLVTRSEGPLGTRSDVPTDVHGGTVAHEVGLSIGRYQLRDELGRGGMGVVYRAFDPELGRDVALKVVRAGAAANDAHKRRFVREARAVARLEHANIVEVYDMGVYAGGVYYTMQYVEGVSLAERIATGPIEPREAARLGIGIARALACAHAAGLIHRDVKPKNILLDGETPKLADFGLVKQLHDDEASAVLTRGGQLLGTPAYMAPEQLGGDSDALVPATDQYALGIILFEMLSGERPFRGVGSDELIRRMTSAEPPKLPQGSVPRELDLIRCRAMAFASDERYEDCGELADDLERFLEGAPVRTAPASLARRARWAWRRYWRRLAVAAAIIAAVVGGVQLRAMWSEWQRERAAQRREAAAEARRLAMEQRVGELLAHNDRQGADDLFQAFVGFDSNRGTRAMARAWLHRGQRFRAQGLPERALDSLAAAYASTEQPGVQSEALIEAAQAFRTRYQWSELARLLQTMRTRTPGALDDLRMHDVRVDSALAERSLDRAADLAAQSKQRDVAQLAPLLAHLAQATASEHQATGATPWDMDGDGQAELVLSSALSSELRVAGLERASLPLRYRSTLPAGYKFIRAFFPLRSSSSPGMVVGSLPHLLLASAHASAPASPPASEPFTYTALDTAAAPLGGSVSVDIDGDGALEHYMSGGMLLYQQIQRSDGAWSPVALDRLNAAPSRITAMVGGDLDGDRRAELVVGSQGWQRYDLQVFQAQATAPDGSRALVSEPSEVTPLRAVHRLQFGAAVRMTILDTPEERLLAVLQAHDPSTPLNHRIFPADAPQGMARGIHLMAFTDGRLQPRGVIPLPRIDDERDQTRWDRWADLVRVVLTTGDLDGDGRDELILVGQEQGTFVYRRRPDGTFRELALKDIELLTLVQLDGDPMPEMVVSLPDRDAQVWVLGAGSDHLPGGPAAATRDRPSRTEEMQPVERDELRARWQRAEDLHQIGLGRAAAEQLQEVATLAVGSVDEGRALFRAGQFLSDDGASADAGALFRHAAAHPAMAPRAWEAAMDAHLVDVRRRPALDAAEQRLALPSPPDRVRATARALRAQFAAPVQRFDFHERLDPAWQIQSPLQIRAEHHGRGVRMTSAGNRPLMTLPIQRTSDFVRVAVAFEIERLDWGSVLEFSIVDHGDPHILFKLQYRGGGAVYDLEVECLGSEKLVIADVDVLHHRRLRLEWQRAADGRTSCELSTGGVADRRAVYQYDRPVTSSRPIALQAMSGLHKGPPATVQVLVHNIEFTGFAVVAGEPTPVQRAHRELALGRPDAALPILRAQAAEHPEVQATLDWQLARAVVAEELGDSATTLSMLRSALATDIALDGFTQVLFRHQLDRFEAPLRTLMGDRYYALFAHHVVPTIRAHRDEGRMHDLLLTHLDGLDERPVFLDIADESRPGHPDDSQRARDATAVARIGLQVWRGRAWRRAGRMMRAMHTLQAALALIRKFLADRTASGAAALAAGYRGTLDSARFDAGRELAACYLARREPERAIDELLATLAEMPAPEVFADSIVASGEFASLRNHPRWQPIERIRSRQRAQASR